MSISGNVNDFITSIKDEDLSLEEAALLVEEMRTNILFSTNDKLDFALLRNKVARYHYFIALSQMEQALNSLRLADELLKESTQP